MEKNRSGESMTVKQFYDTIQEDYNEIYERFLMDKLIYKYVLKFDDDPSFLQLKEALEYHDEEAAFKASHTLKGICSNLSFSQLEKLSSDMTELLRQHQLSDACHLFKALETEYQRIKEAIEIIKM